MHAGTAKRAEIEQGGMKLTYSITIEDTTPPEITVTAPGFVSVNGNVYLDPTIQDQLLAFIEALSDEPAVVIWEQAQPDWRENVRAN